MKKILLILILNLTLENLIFSQATVYHPFPIANAFWQYRHWNSLNASIHTQTRYGLNGDTIIGGNTYHRVFSLFDSTLTNPFSTYYAAIREQNKQVFTVIGSLPEHLLYDFNLSVGDTIHYDYSLSFGGPSNFSRVVTDIDSFLCRDGKYRKQFALDPGINAMPDTVVEGLGSIEWQGLFNPLINAWCTCGDAYEVTCIKESDTTLFLNNPMCDHCFCTFLTSTHTFGNHETTYLYPNPSNGKITLETNIPEKQNVSISDIKGRMVFNQIINGTTTIDVTGIEEGVYSIKTESNIATETKKLVIVK